MFQNGFMEIIHILSATSELTQTIVRGKKMRDHSEISSSESSLVRARFFYFCPTEKTFIDSFAFQMSCIIECLTVWMALLSLQFLPVLCHLGLPHTRQSLLSGQTSWYPLKSVQHPCGPWIDVRVLPVTPCLLCLFLCVCMSGFLPLTSPVGY